MFKKVLTALVLGSFAILPTSSLAQSTGTARIQVDGPVLKIDGEIDLSTSTDFSIQLRSNPQVRTVELNSPGGRVVPALEIARAIKTNGLSTHVSLGDRCYSACSIIFLSGQQRIAEGRLGVHQISGVDDPSLTQTMIGQIYEDLVTFDAPSYVVSHMLRTPPDDMYVFTAEDLERNAINVRLGDKPSVPHLLPLETWLRDEWLVGIFQNTHINQKFVAIESRQMDPVLRVVHYPHRDHSFLEIVFDHTELSGEQAQLEFRFSHGNDPEYSIPATADIESNAYSFDIPSDPNQAAMFWAAFAAGTKLTVLNGAGVAIAQYSLSGSGRAFAEFRTAISR